MVIQAARSSGYVRTTPCAGPRFTAELAVISQASQESGEAVDRAKVELYGTLSASHALADVPRMG